MKYGSYKHNYMVRSIKRFIDYLPAETSLYKNHFNRIRGYEKTNF